MARRRYGTFTPRRRASLHRAQLISASKRHRRAIAIGAGVGVLAVGVGVAAVHGSNVRSHNRAAALTQARRITTGARVGHGKLGDPMPYMKYYRPRSPEPKVKLTDIDVVTQARRRQKTIGSVHTHHGATPRVHVGPVKYSPPNKHGEIRVTRRYNR